VALAVETSGELVTRAGIALTGVGAATIGATAAGAALVGKPLTAETIEEAATLAAEASKPRTDHRGSATFKRHIVHTFVTRLLTQVNESAERAA
jgi:carbon-monoxide dehydrogenase medium subunit